MIKQIYLFIEYFSSLILFSYTFKVVLNSWTAV